MQEQLHAAHPINTYPVAVLLPDGGIAVSAGKLLVSGRAACCRVRMRTCDGSAAGLRRTSRHRLLANEGGQSGRAGCCRLRRGLAIAALRRARVANRCASPRPSCVFGLQAQTAADLATQTLFCWTLPAPYPLSHLPRYDTTRPTTSDGRGASSTSPGRDHPGATRRPVSTGTCGGVGWSGVRRGGPWEVGARARVIGKHVRWFQTNDL